MKIGIIGCGNMGQALARGITRTGCISKRHILVSDKDKKKLNSARLSLKVKVTSSNRELLKRSDLIILAVKPQDINALLRSLSFSLKGKLLISICAGINTKKFQRHLGKVAVVRVMTNMPAQILQGISAISLGKYAKAKDKRIAVSIFSCIGEVVEIKEQLMDAVTAISGSGPAYFFYLVENLIFTAKEMGIPDHIAQRLAIKTALGSAMMMNQSKELPQILRKRVTSKGGTTEAAIKLFRRKGLDRILSLGFQAAAKRSKQLSRKG